MTFQDLLSRLKNGKQYGSKFSALCPAHDDKTNSLSIAEKDGKILLKCFANCSIIEICASLDIEMKDLFLTSNHEQKTLKTGSNADKQYISETYQYCDNDGKLLYENVRFVPKDFRQRRFDDNGKAVWSLNGTKRVPYRLPELIKATRECADIWLCEGEKDADNLRSLGLTASSFKNWKSEFNQILKSAHVCLIQDHDKAGMKQANDAAELLSGNVASLKTIDFFQNEPLPDKHGKDFSDWLESEKQNGLSNVEIAEKLCIFTDNADIWQPFEMNDTEAETDFEETKLKPFPQPSGAGLK